MPRRGWGGAARPATMFGGSDGARGATPRAAPWLLSCLAMLRGGRIGTRFASKSKARSIGMNKSSKFGDSNRPRAFPCARWRTLGRRKRGGTGGTGGTASTLSGGGGEKSARRGADKVCQHICFRQPCVSLGVRCL